MYTESINYFTKKLAMKEKRKVNPIAIELGKRLEILMKAKNLSTAQLAKTLGVSYNTVRKWITGQRFPKEDKLKDLTEFFGVSADYLLFGKSDGIFPKFNEVMALPPNKRFDKMIEIAREETGCPYVVFEDTLRRKYNMGEVSEEEAYKEIKKHMLIVKRAVEKVDGPSS